LIKIVREGHLPTLNKPGISLFYNPDFALHPSACQVTGNPVIWSQFTPFWHHLAALLFNNGAAGVEGTAGRGVRRAGHVACQDNPLPFFL
jgi:hypothetical protein